MIGDIRRFVFFAVCLVLYCGFTAGPALASSGSVITLPAPSAPKSLNGLAISVDTRWGDGYGYRPIRVTVTAAKPTTADQTITFRLKAGDGRKDPYVSVDQDIEMPIGSTSVSAVVAAPRFRQWTVVWWDVLVDGNFEQALSSDRFSRMGGLQRLAAWQYEGHPHVLFVGKAPLAANPRSPATLSLPSAASLPQGSFTTGDNTVTVEGNKITIDNAYGAGSGNLDMATCTTAELPTRWIDYTALDAVAITADDLLGLQTGQPDAFSAIRGWVTTGGTLWIHDIGDRWQKLQRIELALGLAVGERDEETSEPPGRSWLGISKSGELGDWHLGQEEPGEFGALEDSVRRLLAGDKDGTILRKLDMGIVIATARSLERASDVERYFFGKQILARLTWVKRHDLWPDLPDASFAKLLIPGVGLAPVTEFRVLITLFVLVIGPVNYWILKRWKQLHLLVLTVPLAALAITLALFAYASVADGFGTRIRVRSFTLLNQTENQAVCWARLSYYAGLAPSDGLEFSEQVAVYPVLPEWGNTAVFSSHISIPSRVVQWADKQYLTEGWLASRTPTQYLTVATRPSTRRIKITTLPDSMEVTNKLDAVIDFLIVRGPDGQLYWGESVNRDDKATLRPVDESTATARVRRILADHEPEFPIGYDGGRSRRVVRRQYSQNAYSQQNLDVSGNRMDRALQALVAPNGPPGRSLQIENRSYLAVTRTGPEVEMGVSSYSEEASFHVVLGKW